MWLAVSLLLTTVAGLAAGIWYISPYAAMKMDLSLLSTADAAAPSILLAYDPTLRADRTGPLHATAQETLWGGRPRVHTDYTDMPPELIRAFVSIEDKRFFEHKGVDLIRTARATMGYLTGNPSCGGSTITQQLVKNLTGRDEQTPERKLAEIFLALDLERQVGKERVLEAYLNVVNLAEGCFGVGMAAETYFGKSVPELTLPECASLAAITQNPARYNPLTHPETHLRRRNLVLSCMAEQGYITQAEWEEAASTPLTAEQRQTEGATGQVNSWYTDLVISDVIRDLTRRLGYTETAATRLVYFGGLTIETAMDEALQGAVEDYYGDLSHFPEGDGKRPQSSCIVLDPYTGDILAVAGAVGEKRADRLQNYATDTRRPAGSCIKPLSVYAPALERGMVTWGSVLSDEPLTEKGGRPWPANADGLYRGRVTVAEAVARSLNPPAVELLEQVGTGESLAFLRDQLGMTSLISPAAGAVHDGTVSSLALGQQSVGVTSRELTAAYTALYGGLYREAVSYHRVLDREGNLLLENPPVAHRVLSEETAAILTHLLMGVNSHEAGGTAARYLQRTPTLGMETAGKTGTTQGGCDRRYIGMTPRLLTGVWMGYDYPSRQDGIKGNPCVGIWDDLTVICEALYGAPQKVAFDLPASLVEVEFCPLSGCAMGPWCGEAYTGRPTARGWFARGTEPTEVCPLHEEPPITVTPHDPTDPNRIPLLPDDLIPDEAPSREKGRFMPKDTPKDEGENFGIPWLSRWFSRFSRG